MNKIIIIKIKIIINKELRDEFDQRIQYHKGKKDNNYN